jgi:ribosomal protein S18 acetylase RimI-like enzyme
VPRGSPLCAPRDEDQDPATVAEIAALYLEPCLRGAGIGCRLMTAALETFAQARYRQATLWVLGTNAHARRFYEAAGWRADGAVRQDTTRGFAVTDVRYRHALG